MLTEMAAMSLDDGLVMQLHPGSFRNHNPDIFRRSAGTWAPTSRSATDYVRALKPLLDRFGNEKDLTLILFTLDETSYGRELAPLAGHYPCLKLGPPWWFYDSPEGMRRFRELTTETAGFYNTVGFNDDTRAYLSIPARHDMARRVDCAFLADLVTSTGSTRTRRTRSRRTSPTISSRRPTGCERGGGGHPPSIIRSAMTSSARVARFASGRRAARHLVCLSGARLLHLSGQHPGEHPAVPQGGARRSATAWRASTRA